MTKKKSLTVSEIAENVPVVDYAELLIDAFVESDALGDIPIVSTIFGVSKVYRKAKELRFKRRVEKFHSAAGSFTEDEMREFAAQLDKEGKKEEFIIELIEIVERADSEQKSRIIGGVFRRLVKKEITLSQFDDQVKVTQTMMLMDIFHFMHGYHNSNILEDGLGDILLVLRLTKKEISLATRTSNIMRGEKEQYIKTIFTFTGNGLAYLMTLHQVYKDTIQPGDLYVGGPIRNSNLFS
jgi:hypothetical protein